MQDVVPQCSREAGDGTANGGWCLVGCGFCLAGPWVDRGPGALPVVKIAFGPAGSADRGRLHPFRVFDHRSVGPRDENGSTEAEPGLGLGRKRVHGDALDRELTMAC
jgi:hypothetical protein